jgi:AcrR family transcriptional regulator
MNRPVRTGTDSDEAHARILEVAEEHFRRIGYHKTSVADIASELGMSPSNVYRFFPSRDAINESICERVLNEAADIAFAIAHTNAPAGSVMPDAVFSNIGKLLLATKIYDMHRVAHYVSGGLIVALPGPEETITQRPRRRSPR